TPPTVFSPLSLHDALPISAGVVDVVLPGHPETYGFQEARHGVAHGGGTRVDDVHRAGGIGADELHLDPAALADVGHPGPRPLARSEEHTSELQSREKLVCR